MRVSSWPSACMTARSRTCGGGSAIGDRAREARELRPLPAERQTPQSMLGPSPPRRASSLLAGPAGMMSWWRSRSSATSVRAVTPSATQQPTRPSTPGRSRSCDCHVAESAFEHRFGKHRDERVAALHGLASRSGRVLEVDEQRARQPLSLKPFAHVIGKRSQRRLEAASS